ncbi:hypothetical protein TIFTF001_025060 [Ficus carica]|uniref:Uncharacterized protein n=1 Tax=Ficus carica TaxID=3494 RepID=A0AA88AWD5_FICCA|nr:hypothetical protein TIFTF001_025060 [Ficus carica]
MEVSRVVTIPVIDLSKSEKPILRFEKVYDERIFQCRQNMPHCKDHEVQNLKANEGNTARPDQLHVPVRKLVPPTSQEMEVTASKNSSDVL